MYIHTYIRYYPTNPLSQIPAFSAKKDHIDYYYYCMPRCVVNTAEGGGCGNLDADADSDLSVYLGGVLDN